MTGQQLRNTILQEAIQGRLVPNVLEAGEKIGPDLLQAILAERQEQENKEKGKNAKKLTISTIEKEPWELPEGWCWCKLGDVGVFTRGNGIKKDEVISDGFPCVRYGELYTRYRFKFNLIVSHVNEATYNKSQKIETGDIVMALTGENEYDIALASVYLGDVPVAMGGDMTKLHPFIDSKYLVYCINSPYFIQCKSLLATGQIIVHISNDKLASIAIPLPPLSIQKAIVKKIEDLFPLVDEYDKAAGKLESLNKILPDKLRKSVLQEAIKGNLVSNDIPEGEETAPELLQQILKERQNRESKAKGKKAKKLTLSTIEEEPWELPKGWCWCKLGDVGEFTRGNGIKKDEVIPEGFPCVRYGELYTRYRIQFSSTFSHVNEDIYNKAQKIENGDVVMALTGENEYDIALASVYLGTTPVAMGGDMTKLHPFIDSKYLVYAINSPYGIECKSLLATGQIIVHISNDKLASIQIPLPPLTIQHRIVEKIEKVFSIINELEISKEIASRS